MHALNRAVGLNERLVVITAPVVSLLCESALLKAWPAAHKLGYNAIGSGGIHASILLSLTGQHRDLSVAETVFNVCAAKVNAEVAPGVGNQTDLTIFTKDGVKFLSEGAIAKLRELHKKTAARTIPLADVEKILGEHVDEKKA